MSQPLPLFDLDFNYAYGAPVSSATLKQQPSDFFVAEELGFEPSGSGEHLFLQVEKVGVNTAQAATQIARLVGVKTMDVGYCGMKDRNAVTRQWFSIYLPVKPAEFRWAELEASGIKILAQAWHKQKLRRGQHRHNAFELVLRNIDGDPAELQARLVRIEQDGVPNYFGPQRFGADGSNLIAADHLFRTKQKLPSRHLRGLAISAARSYLFNQVLSLRVAQANWRQCLPGEISFDASPLLPTGPLWGRGRLASQAEVQKLESEVAQLWPQWCDALEHQGLKQERRQLCLQAQELSWQWIENAEQHDLVLKFALPPGGYATSLVRELCHC